MLELTQKELYAKYIPEVELNYPKIKSEIKKLISKDRDLIRRDNIEELVSLALGYCITVIAEYRENKPIICSIIDFVILRSIMRLKDHYRKEDKKRRVILDNGPLPVLSIDDKNIYNHLIDEKSDIIKNIEWNDLKSSIKERIKTYPFYKNNAAYSMIINDYLIPMAEGSDGKSVRQIAQESGISVTEVYKMVKDKNIKHFMSDLLL